MWFIIIVIIVFLIFISFTSQKRMEQKLKETYGSRDELNIDLGDTGIELSYDGSDIKISSDGLEPYPDDTKMMWIAVGGHEICSDCLNRAGVIKTISEWEQDGMPGDGKTKCGDDCYCILEPASTAKLSPSIYFMKSKMKKEH